MTEAWDNPDLAESFRRGAPNPHLLALAAELMVSNGSLQVVDIGCGAGRNAVALAKAGHRIMGIDPSAVMRQTAADYATAVGVSKRCQWLDAHMHALPVPDGWAQLIISHGVWNLAQSDAEFHQSIAEARRIAEPGAHLFAVCFDRASLPDQTMPLEGQSYTYSGLNGQAQCFLRPDQLDELLAAQGFLRLTRDQPRRKSGSVLAMANQPVLVEAAYRLASNRSAGR